MPSLPIALLTGFEPFGGETVNPSWEAVRQLDGKRLGGHRVVARLLPTAFDASLRELKGAVRALKPTLLLGVGQAGGRSRLSIERVAINLQDASIPDNAGAQPMDTAVIAGAPAAYFSSLPVKAMVAALNQAGLPAELSYTAGTYVCNHVAFAMLHLAARHRHASSMALDDVVRGLSLALRVAATTQHDAPLRGGALD